MMNMYSSASSESIKYTLRPVSRRFRAHVMSSCCEACGQTFSHTADFASSVCPACRSLESFEQAQYRFSKRALCC